MSEQRHYGEKEEKEHEKEEKEYEKVKRTGRKSGALTQSGLRDGLRS